LNDRLVQLRQVELVVLAEAVGEAVAAVAEVVDLQLAGVGLLLPGLPLLPGDRKSVV